jgi:hypothetical protein
MDTLSYGISSPQLALMKNGAVFVAGQYEPPMNPPTTQAQTSGIRAMDVSQSISTITAGSDLFGTIAPVLPVFEVQSVQFQSGIPVSYSYGTTSVQGPNWTNGVDTSDGGGSSRPAVYLVNGGPNGQNNQMTVTLSIDEAWKGHTAQLTGTLNESGWTGWGNAPLKFCSVNSFSLNDTSSSGLTIPMTISNLPSTMDWFCGQAQWTVTLDNGQAYQLPGATRLEVFVVWSAPTQIYTANGGNGVWPEVLRPLFTNSSASYSASQPSSIAGITNYLFNRIGVIYNVAGGGTSNYIDDPSSYGGDMGGPFKLNKYLCDFVNNPVNCFDQGGAIQTFAGALGISTNWIYSCPFGYIPGQDQGGNPIASTDLIGIGNTNNPFGTPLVIDWNDVNRTFFFSHVYISYNGNIFDATAGPHLGTEDGPTYQLRSIDGLMSGTSRYNWLYVNQPWPHSAWAGEGVWQYGQPGNIPSNLVPTGITGVE